MAEIPRTGADPQHDLAATIREASKSLTLPQAHCLQAAMVDRRAPEIQEWSAPVRMTIMEEFEELVRRGGHITITRRNSESSGSTGPLKELLAEVSRECTLLREFIASETFQPSRSDLGSSEYERERSTWHYSHEIDLRIIDTFLDHAKDGSWDTMFSARSEIDAVEKLAERKSKKTPALSEALRVLYGTMRYSNEESIEALRQKLYAPVGQKLGSFRETVDAASGVKDRNDYRRWSGLAILDDVEAKARNGQKETIRNSLEHLLEMAHREKIQRRDGTFDGQKALDALSTPTAKPEVSTQPVDAPRAGATWSIWKLLGR